MFCYAFGVVDPTADICMDRAERNCFLFLPPGRFCPHLVTRAWQGAWARGPAEAQDGCPEKHAVLQCIPATAAFAKDCMLQQRLLVCSTCTSDNGTDRNQAPKRVRPQKRGHAGCLCSHGQRPAAWGPGRWKPRRDRRFRRPPPAAAAS